MHSGSPWSATTHRRSSWTVAWWPTSPYTRREKRQEDDAPEREAPQDFAARMQDFAARLRQAATGIDQDAFADRAAALRDGREADERHTAQEVAREQERVKELERAQEREIQRGRRRGIGMM